MGKPVTKEQLSALFTMIAQHKEDEMVAMLVDNSSLVGASNEDGWSAVHRCAKHGTSSMMKKLIVDFHANVDALTRGNYTPTQIAADYNNISCLLELVLNQADTSIYNLSHKNPLDFLAENHQEIIPFNKDGNFLSHHDGHLAVKIGEYGPMISLHDFLEC